MLQGDIYCILQLQLASIMKHLLPKENEIKFYFTILENSTEILQSLKH